MKASSLGPIPDGTITRLSRWVLAHRRLVIAVWLVVFIAGAAGAGSVSKRLSLNFSLPGQPGYETAKQIAPPLRQRRRQPVFGAGRDRSAGQDRRGEQGQIARVRRGAAVDPRTRIVDCGVTHDQRFVTNDGRTTFALLFTPLEKSFGAPKIPLQAERIGRRLGCPAARRCSSPASASSANGGSSKGPGVLVETLIGGAGALAVLAFVFASLLAFVPLLIAAVSILTTLLVVLGLTYVRRGLVHRRSSSSRSSASASRSTTRC